MHPEDSRVAAPRDLRGRWSVVLAAGAILAPAPAWAYVDPGVVGMLYQAVYAILFGGLMAWLLKPWRYVRSLFTRDKPGDDGKGSS